MEEIIVPILILTPDITFVLLKRGEEQRRFSFFITASIEGLSPLSSLIVVSLLVFLILIHFFLLCILLAKSIQIWDPLFWLESKNIRIWDLLWDLLSSLESKAYTAADVVVSIAGAMTCSELTATGKPAILIPSPNEEEGHQFSNATLMANLAGSRMIIEDELDSTTLRMAIEETMGSEYVMSVMSERALQAAKPKAGAEIAERILSLANSPVKLTWRG